MRSIRVASPSRLVITAAVCGISAMPAKVAPPLKSARTRFSTSEEWVTASASTMVRSTSDLPEPVAPTHMPCGPMPSSEASLMSSQTYSPLLPTPSGTRSFSRIGFGRQCRAGSKEPGSPVCIISVKSIETSDGSLSSPPADARNGANCRDSASACHPDRLSGVPG